MRARAKTTIAAIAVSALVVVGTDAVTYAGTGDSLILGKLNKANKTTHVTSTGTGPALALHAKGNRPALAVDSNAKVVRFNADRVDGHDAAALQNNVRVYTARTGSSDEGAIEFHLPDFPNGRYLATYNVYLHGTGGTAPNPADAFCFLFDGPGDANATGDAMATSVGPVLRVSGTAIVDSGASPWSLYCRANQHGVGYQEWSVKADIPVRVTLTRIDKTVAGSLDVGRTAQRSGKPARTGR